MVEVAVIGVGPWGLCVLERLLSAARDAPDSEVTIHVVDPRRPGSGLFGGHQPDYLILNTPCGQHTLHPTPDEPGWGESRATFFEWALHRGYRHTGGAWAASGAGVDPTPHDFLPRRLMGAYLEWFYESLVAEAPRWVRVRRHQSEAVDIEATSDRRERVRLADGSSLTVDHAILTTGHAKVGGPSGDRHYLDPYPVDGALRGIEPAARVAVEGMGLVALDVLSALTVGRGGRFVPAARDGHLRYLPSGREPTLYFFSRTGYPLCAKSIGTVDPMGAYQPAICTEEAVRRIRLGLGRDHPGQLDARHDLLPLVFAEMELRYYTRAAERRGAGSARTVREALIDAWNEGRFELARRELSAEFGMFEAAEHFFVGHGATFIDGKDYESQVYNFVVRDADEASDPEGPSPLKAGLETVRALRDVLRAAVEFKGLTLDSHLDFQGVLRSRLARLVAGPPLQRARELSALIDAEVLRLRFGPDPEVIPADGRSVVVRSTRLEHPTEMHLDVWVRAHLDPPSIDEPSSPLLASLRRRGRVRPLHIGGVPVGSVDLTEDFHPIDTAGRSQPSLWIFGALTEGVRYFTAYIPSPKSRVRAFVDAQRCAEHIVGARSEALSSAR